VNSSGNSPLLMDHRFLQCVHKINRETYSGSYKSHSRPQTQALVLSSYLRLRTSKIIREAWTGFERATKGRQEQCLIPQLITGSVFPAGTVLWVPTLPDLPHAPGDSFSYFPLQLAGSCSGSDHLVGHGKGMK
jgi:hypothetical protein